MAGMIGLDIEVDIYEPNDFTRFGAAGCNHCGGIISESLVQILAADGIALTTSVVQWAIDSYVLHMDEGTVHIETPLHEKRIAAVHRGAGPRGTVVQKWESFDGFLLNMAVDKGARVLTKRVEKIVRAGDRLEVTAKTELPRLYDFVVGAIGINTNAFQLFQGLDFEYQPPQFTKTFICELPMGEELVQEYLGSSMHVFLLDMPRLEFAALIPKGDVVTVCLLGEEIDSEMVEQFLDAPQVLACLPADWHRPLKLCHCAPRINITGASQPFADRLALVGDCGVTRLYKDGIGAAYRMAKSVASTAIFKGVSREDFSRHYGPIYKSILSDNRVGKLIFAFTRVIQKTRLGRESILRMVVKEQREKGSQRRMSAVLWDTFTGSTTYRDIFLHSLHPAFLFGLLYNGMIVLCQRLKPTSIVAFFRRSASG
jgi:flavin-dependent dehydrogenase